VVVFACLAAGLAVVALGFQTNRAKAEKGGPQLLRYRWKPGNKLHYALAVIDKTNPHTSSRVVDVTIQKVKDGRATLDVHLGCTGGTCTPHFATFSVNTMGEVGNDASTSDFPLIQFPASPVAPGATWTRHQVLKAGKETVDSQCKYLGLRHIGHQTFAEVESKFTLAVNGRTTSGTWSVLLDMANGLPWQSTVHNEADMIWTRS